ncbi:MAG: SOS response-associated peptidase [Deltaproteobacteria bacterium]|nr:SOS response-associated peptidase [Deltaproteobacteria bacterium]
MCGRFTLALPPELIAEVIGGIEQAHIQLRYNIAPTQLIAVIRQNTDGRRHLEYLRWGLIPPWAKDASIGNHMINARSETVHEKPAFRHAFRSRRCLIPASGFYEWRTDGGKKQPLYIQMKDRGPMIFAGLWESWRSSNNEIAESCTIITTSSNSLIQPLHDRMPVILDRNAWDTWLSPAAIREQLTPLFQPFPSDLLDMYPVGTGVNSPRNDSPDLIEPLLQSQAEQ